MEHQPRDDSTVLGEEVEETITDEADKEDDSVPALRYDVTSYGIDFDVDGLVRRLNSEDIIIPEWQRRYIWSVRQASSFIESLLFGLPVPGIFLAKNSKSGQLEVIDGQQRLKTLQFFFNEEFNPVESARSRPVFKLQGVDERFLGLSLRDLTSKARRDLNNSLIHATVVKQESPPDDDTSMYQIFKRLNTGGVNVTPQEIRCAIYQGGLITTIKQLNEYSEWRRIVGKSHARLKDEELILRFLAMMHVSDQYTKPMVEFLNVFTQLNMDPDAQWVKDASALFKDTIRSFAEAVARPFRLGESRTVNAAVFDSMTVGLARRIGQSGSLNPSTIASVHESLINDEGYLQAVLQGTSDEASVAQRLRIATVAFGK